MSTEGNGKDKNVKKLFGTDGVRGTANQFPMTPEIAMQIGRAVGFELRNARPELSGSGATSTDSNTTQDERREANLGVFGIGHKGTLPIGLKPLESSLPIRRAKVVVGKDTRLSGYMIEQALCSGLLSMGVDVIIIGPLPTPGVAFVTQNMRADAGIMISASHNAYRDNGIKIFNRDGYKLPDEMEEEMSRMVLNEELENERPLGDLIGKAFRMEDVLGRYLVFLKGLFPRELDLKGVRIVLDCANGAGYKVAPLVFEELGAEVIKLGVNPNGLNINAKCGALHPETLAGAVVQYRADIGIGLDGDGDRCILADENGEIVDGDQIIGLCALQMQSAGLLKKNTVVTTPMSNAGLEFTLKQHGINMVRAQVGDRYVVEEMRKNGYNFGGEQSGHIVFLDHSTTGDGVLAALKVLEVMIRKRRSLGNLKRDIALFAQSLENIRIARRESFEKLPKTSKAIDDANKKLVGKGRVFIRYSGTEPLARILVEGQDQGETNEIARTIAKAMKEELS